MRLPFTAGQFFAVFRQYNEAVWPAQLALNALALLCVVAVVWPRPWTGRFVSAVLAFLWAWLAVAYHLWFFARINPLAYGFAALSALGAGLFFWFGVVRSRMHFSPQRRSRALTGAGLVVYALIAYPLLSILAGYRYPETPTFGLPCPTTIFTIGLLALMTAPRPRSVFVVPILWCVVGVQAAFLLGVPQDLALAAAALAGLWLMR